MYELNRVRLYNIGPTRARYDDVLLDLSGGGPPIATTTLVPAPGQLYRRPTPATLLILENGGGKSVFIRILLSTVLPKRQSRKGRESLRAYVVSKASPSHVALEWVHVRTGQTLLIGQVLTPGADGRLERLFYSFAPNDTTGLTDLPFAAGRRRLPLTDFHDALKRLDAADKSLRMEFGTAFEKWESHLRGLGLEPDLFAVQQAMNADEGDAAEAFKTSTGRQFVEWLISKALDVENYTDLGKAFGRYAKNIGQREQLLLERDFSTTTAAAARTLASCHTEQRDAATAAHNAATVLAQLAGAVRESMQRSNRMLDDHREDLETAKRLTADRKRIRDDADLLLKEVKRRTLVLRCAQARSDAATAGDQLAAERAELAAWALVPKVLSAARAHEKYQLTIDLLDAAEQAAGEARLRRDQAGARLASALHTAAQRCQAQADDLAGRSEQANEQATEADRRAADDDRQATSNTIRAELLAEQVEAVDARVAHARDNGLVEVGETIGDAQARLRAAADNAKAAAVQGREDLDRLVLEVRRLDEAARQLIEPEISARQAVQTAAQAVHDIETAARTLTTDPLLRELAELDVAEDIPGGDPALWLESNAAVLRSLADATHATAVDRLDALAADNRADQRLIDALTVEDDALLPPREDIERLLKLLTDHDVTAIAGWRALEQLVNPLRHAEMIQAHPALVDGIVVPDRTSLDTARQVLTEARPLPAAAVLVATTDAFAQESVEPAVGFVVEPTPALHDPQIAADLQEQAETRIENRRPTIEQLTDRRAAASRLGSRLESWLDAHPAGETARRRSAADAATHAAAQAKSAISAARDEHKNAADTADQRAIVVREVEEAADDANRIAESVAQLSADVTAAGKHRADIARLESEAEGHRTSAEEAQNLAQRLRTKATEHAVQAESLRRDSASYTERLTTIVYGNQPLSADAGDSASADLATLEIAYQEASDGYRAVEVGEDLRRRVDDAQKEASALDTDLLGEPAETVARAKTLAATPEAGSPASIEAQKRRLARAVSTLEAEHSRLKVRVGELQAQTAAASQRNQLPWTTLDADWTPSDHEHGVLLTQQATDELNDAEALHEAASESEKAADRKLRKAEAATRGMKIVHQGLATATRKLELPRECAPFAGTVEEAQHAANTAIQAHAAAADRLHEANRSVDEAVLEFRHAANQHRFGKLKAPVHKQLTEIDTAALIARADQWATQLTGRAASLTNDLELSDQHRRVLIDQLLHHVSEALALLDKAERLSRLPDGAGVWGGRKILKIGFAKPEPQVLAVRVAETLDENARAHPNLHGHELVLRSMGAAVPRDFKVEILKPDSAGRAEYASISEMATVFSGGQELTGAILLYCTLAALRSSTRTPARHSRLGGMLILDNPIGKANADYLLNLQMNMAAALGVQLIYTTPSMEDRVLATFPLCIRLRNDADQRTGTRHLHVTARLTSDSTMDEAPVTGQISAARLLRKPHQLHIATEPQAVIQNRVDAETDGIR
ncbi:hypothetical protein CJ469_02605 [Nocardia farcinica]|uniref:hypothetical protein n=1 Tax=Nocardia farcinica TaxID=37329 RepID=UPI000BF455F4|nr:hypothetical protein [Nocardia farcinica]PFX02160.1 hypothetical protein CJ469_02605 [Nocardia farcinica]PFX08210.1 hypothetical protein CJ468_02759 [Nocardia farcinica]